MEAYLMVYVDDVIIVGNYLDELFAQIKEHVLLRPTGELTHGETCKFLGRRLKHNGDSISLPSRENYIESILEEHGLANAKQASVPGSKR